MGKRQITNISSVGIIYQRNNPRHIFIEAKDDGHPLALVRRQLCPIGGNWIGPAAKTDDNPLETFRREVLEEISFGRPTKSSLELALLGQADIAICAPSPAPQNPVSADDRIALAQITTAICQGVSPFGTFLNTVTKDALDAADSSNKRDGFVTLSCYWLVGLSTDDWSQLQRLQNTFGNLSNESITLITSLDEILKTGVKSAFAHDRVLQKFFLAMGFTEARNFPMVEGLESEYAGTALPTYDDYLGAYDIAKRP